MDYTRALTFVFREHKWIKKIIITGLVSLIPVAGLIHLIGWATEIVKRTIADDYEKIPEAVSWSYLVRGLKLVAVFLVYFIPNAVLWLLLGFFKWVWALLFGGALESAGVHFLQFLQNATNFVYFILFLFIMPAIILVFLETERFRNAFDFKKVYLMVKNNQQTFFILIVAFAVATVIASLGVSLFYVGIVLTIPYAAAMYANLIGQAGKTL